MKKKITILGSTGSIGTSTLEIIDFHRDKYEIVALTANSNIDLLAEQVEKYKPSFIAVSTTENGEKLKQLGISNGAEVGIGREALQDAANYGDPDIVVSAIAGSWGLVPTYAAIREGRTIALANKETLVMGGEFILEEARKSGSEILPVDSEHSAVFQSLLAGDISEVNRIILTASGGPFYHKSFEELKNASPSDALKHPVWDMGRKITIGSASMANKGLEVIEAVHLFGVPKEKIDVVIHPQSFIHSMVEYVDGSIIAQMGTPDMRTPIQYALSWPEREHTPLKYFSFTDGLDLQILPRKDDIFRALPLAYKSLENEPAGPIAFNAADEIAIDAYLEEKISFPDIYVTIEEVLSSIGKRDVSSIDDILNIDDEAAKMAEEIIEKLRKK